MEKTELREMLRRRLDDVSAANVAAASKVIVDRLINEIVWQDINRLCLYRPVVNWHEIDLSLLVKWLHSHYPEISCTILPQAKDAVLPNDPFDVILIPLLGYDASCSRLGRGSGWYDRFLANQPQAIKIGVAFAIQLVDIVPVEPHDIKLDKVITEEAVYSEHD